MYVRELEEHWKQPYIGPSCALLQQKIRRYTNQFTIGSSYGRTVTLVQSDGAGKSRLADELGHLCPMANYVLRPPNGGYPPSDDRIYEFVMSDSPPLNPLGYMGSYYHTLDDREEYMWYHAVAIGLLQATFNDQCRPVS